MKIDLSPIGIAAYRAWRFDDDRSFSQRPDLADRWQMRGTVCMSRTLPMCCSSH